MQRLAMGRAWQAGRPATCARVGLKRPAPQQYLQNSWARAVQAPATGSRDRPLSSPAVWTDTSAMSTSARLLHGRLGACAPSVLPGPRRRDSGSVALPLLRVVAWNRHALIAPAAGSPAYFSSSNGGGAPLPPPRPHPSAAPPLPPPWGSAATTVPSLSGRSSSSDTIDDEAHRSISQGAKQLRQSEVVVKRSIGGNLIIAGAKFVAYWYCGSTAMLTEAIHSLADMGNQCLLLVGLRESASVPDKRHQYGYGKSVYMWGLVSAVGCFWLGACMSLMGLFLPGEMAAPGWVTWSVLGLSFAVDGYVLWINLRGLAADKPRSRSWMAHLHRIRDPTTVAVVVEDICACLGVGAAVVGVALTELTGASAFDAAASIFISGMLAGAGGYLALRNSRFLLGQSIEPERLAAIEKIMMQRGSIEDIHHVQSQWLSPEYFAFKAEVDFSGRFLNRQLFDRYAPEYEELSKRLTHGEMTRDAFMDEMRVLQTLYAEDVTRVLEREVRAVEADIRREHHAAFVDLEPDSRSHGVHAIDEWRRGRTIGEGARENWAEFTKKIADEHRGVKVAAEAAAAAAAAGAAGGGKPDRNEG